MKTIFEIEEVVNGYRINLFPADSLIRKENSETYLEALHVLKNYLSREIIREELKLRPRS